MKDLSHYLLADEKILWSGTPAPGLLLTHSDWFVIPFSLIWTGGVFTGFVAMVSAEDPDPMGVLITSFMTLVGVFLVVGRFVLDAYIRRNLDYALTDRRILIARSGLGRKFTAMHLDRIADVDIDHHARGRGTIRFGQGTISWPGANFNWAPALSNQPQFLNIENAQSVFNQVQAAIQRPA
jgi:hypothetical protein